MMKYIRTKLESQKDSITKKRKSTSGFTLAEVLIVVAIMVILMGLAAVAVLSYQKSLKLTEMDSTARQIFVAAQNHMTASKASGEWETQTSGEGLDDEYFGEKITDMPGDFEGGSEAWEKVFSGSESENHEFRYYMYTPDKSSDVFTTDSVLSEMLPFGALDDTVRVTGSYVIEYDYKTASVYGVFYTDKADADFEADVQSLNTARGDAGKDTRKNHKPIIGYYGGAVASQGAGEELDPIDVKIHNSDKLVAEIIDPNFYNDGRATRVVVNVTGEDSKEKLVMPLELQNYTVGANAGKNTGSAMTGESWWEFWTVEKTEDNQLRYEVVLDDITTAGGHFAEIFGDAFIPGENLTLNVSCTSASKLSTTVTAEGYTNSLFGARYNTTRNTVEISTAAVANIRHLQNLNKEISNLPLDTQPNASPSISRVVKEVTQTKNLNWTDESKWFADSKGDALSWADQNIYKYSSTGEEVIASEKSFYGVVNKTLESYDGGQHVLTNFVLGEYQFEDKTYSGIFPVLGAEGNVPITIQNVLIENPTATAVTAATGALVGMVNGTGTTILNCGVYEQSGEIYKQAFDKTPSKYLSTGENGNVGGLIGQIRAKESVTDKIVIRDSFAAVPVKAATGNAGGLIGSISKADTLVTNCYAGGYTVEQAYSEDSYNVQLTGASGNAGGLIGLISDSAAIQNSYSTCSVYGNCAGGLIGVDETSNGIYTNCYSVGKVEKSAESSTAGAFAGKLSAGQMTTCYYLAGINSGIPSIAEGNSADDPELKAQGFAQLQKSSFTESRNEDDVDVKPVTGGTAETHNYDSVWNNTLYPFATVTTTAQNKTTANKAEISDGVKISGIHYGDWPDVSFDAELAYYEIYRTSSGAYSLGLYNQTLRINSLIGDPDASNIDIIQDGYVTLSSVDEEVQVSLNSAAETSTHGISAITINNQALSIRPAAVVSETETLSWKSEGTPLSDAEYLTDGTTVEFQDQIYYLKFWDLLAVDAISSTSNYYSQAKVSQSGTDLYYYVNPHYAMSAIQKSGLDENNGIDSDSMAGSANIGTGSNPVLIRTERQYSMMTQDLQNPSAASNTVFAKYYNLHFSQQLNLNFSNQLTYVQSYFGIPSSSAATGGVSAIAPVSAAASVPSAAAQDDIGFSGVYHGNNHDINNLSIINTSGSNTTTGMFGNTQGALIENLTLNNVSMSGTSRVGSVVGSAAHAVSKAASGSGKAYTSIENVHINGASLTGNKYVGGLVGAAYSCSVNANNTTDTVTLSDISATGDSVIGSVFGILQNWGIAVSDGFLYRNISVLGDNQLTETNVHSNNYLDAGIGGFVGEIYPATFASARGFNFSNIHIGTGDGSLAINIMNSPSNKRIYGGLFIGNICGSLSGSFDMQKSFVNCDVSNTSMTVGSITDAAYDSRYSYGGLVGNINCSPGTTVTFGSGLSLGNNCAISYQENDSTGKCAVGGILGNVNRAKVVLAINQWNVPALSGFTVNNTAAYGNFIGSVAEGAAITSNALTININIINSITANSLGGLIGSIISGSLDMSKATGINVTGTARTSASSSAEDFNVGGVVGLAGSGVTLSNINVSSADFECLGGTNVSIGGIVGKANAAIVTNSSVNNISLRGNADYVGGFVGIALGASFTNCDVRSTELNTGYSVNEQGEYLRNNQVSSIAVTGMKEHTYAGGFAGNCNGANITSCFAAVPVKATASYVSLGGFVGISSGSDIQESYASGNILNHDYVGNINNADQVASCSYSGGFVGIIDGNSNIYDCYATGIVQRGTITAGFVAEIPLGAATYLNNDYSIGRVDQQITENQSMVLHGGFMGRNLGAVKQAPLDLNQVQVSNFYDLLELKLDDKTAMDAMGLSAEDKAICEKCLVALKKRGNTNGTTSIVDYLVKTNVKYNIDSTAATRGSGASLDAENPSVSAIVQTLLDISKFGDLKNLIKTWRLTVESGKVIFYYSVVDIENLYATTDVETAVRNNTPYTIVGYKYEKRTDSSGQDVCYQTKGSISLTTAKLNGSTSYGNYVLLSSKFTPTDPAAVVVPTEVVKEVYTGCTYLREDARGYNACNNWSDSSDAYVLNISHRDFSEFTDPDGAYLRLLNSDADVDPDGMVSLESRFVIGNAATWSYNIMQHGAEYPFPAFSAAVGNTGSGSTYWGDWPQTPDKISDDFGLIYYEKVNGALQYHGYTSNFAEHPGSESYTEIKTLKSDTDNGLVYEKGKHVSEDGYLILVPLNMDIKKLDIQLGGRNINQVTSSTLLTKVTESAGISTDEALQKYDLYFLNLNQTIDKDKVFDAKASTISVGYADGGVFGKHSVFSMTPYFADSVEWLTDNTKTSYSADTFQVRSAKQQRFLAQNSGFFGNPEYTFVQSLDIDYTATDYTDRGTACQYQFLTPMPTVDSASASSLVFSADYKSLQVEEAAGDDVSPLNIVSGYEVKGIRATLFRTIGTGATISGVTVTDVQVSDDLSDRSDLSDGVAFAQTNNGTIESCTVRPSDEDYSSVKVERKSGAPIATAGFIWTNNGTIRNSSFIGTVELRPNTTRDSKDRWANLSGFADVNAGIIEDSYANTVLNFYAPTVSGDYYTAGFCQSNRGGTSSSDYEHGIIRNCHAISDINYYVNGSQETADDVGRSIGFVKLNGSEGSLTHGISYGRVDNCYSVVNGMTGQDKRAFIFKNNSSDSALKDNYYLKWSEGTFNNTAGAAEKTYSEMKAIAAAGQAVASKAVTHAYKEELKEQAYPFALSTASMSSPFLTMQHYGDWPESNEKNDIGLMYYEKLSDDDTLYYHGYTGELGGYNYAELKTPEVEEKNLNNHGLRTDPGSYVTEDGYLVLLPEWLSVEETRIAFGSQGRVKDAADYLKKAEDEAVIGLGEFKGYTPYYLVNYERNDYTLEESNNKVRIGTADQYYGFSEYATFDFTPYFGDSVQRVDRAGNILDAADKYCIRSARQLINLREKKQYLDDYRAIRDFEQQLDIDFNQNFTENASDKKYEYTEPVEQMISKNYTSLTYEGNDGVTYSYSISGLKSYLFSKIDGDSVVKNVTILDMDLSGAANNKYGFADVVATNAAVLNCSIRAGKADANGYEAVKIGNEETDGVAGFVGTNEGRIENSYVTGIVTGNRAAGFVGTNEGTIKNCYSNTVVLANQTAVGFCDTNSGNTIEKSYALVSLSTLNSGGTVYGFVRNHYNNSEVRDSYVAMDQINAGINGQIYLFGNTNDSTWTNCYYMIGGEVTGTIQNDNKTQGITFQQLAAMAKDSEAQAAEDITKAYGSAVNPDAAGAYPFPFYTSTEEDSVTAMFYGDWPKQREIPNAGIAYYEKAGTTTAYHGYVNKMNSETGMGEEEEITSEPELASAAGQYVSEDGYVLLVPKGKSSSYSFTIETVNYGNVVRNVLPLTAKYESILSEADALKYDAYIINDETQKLFSSNEASQVTLNYQGAAIAEFTMTPHFGDSVEYGTEKQTSFVIRSARQLLNLQDKKEFAENAEYSFEQQLDISYDTNDVACTTGNTGTSQSVTYTFENAVAAMNADYTSRTYTDTDENICGYKIKGIQTNLFGTIGQNAVIKGVTITNVKFTKEQTYYPIETKSTAGFAVTNNGLIESCSIRADQNTAASAKTDVAISGKQIPVSGFVDTNSAAGIIKNSYVTGTLNISEAEGGNNTIAGFVQTNAGSIESCYSNCDMAIAGTQQYIDTRICGFVYTNTGTIKDSHALGSANISAYSKSAAYGFVNSNSGEGTITNCYSALSEMSAKDMYAFEGTVSGQTTGSIADSCYLSDTVGKAMQGTVPGLTYQELAVQVNDMGYAAQERTTKRYDQMLDLAYPYALSETTDETMDGSVSSSYLTMQHYGDWAAAPIEAALAYHETYENEADGWFAGWQNAEVPEPDLTPEVLPEPDEKTVNTAIAYRENNGQGYEGWYVIRDGQTGDDEPYHTLTTAGGVTLADTDTSYGILITEGMVPEVEGAELEAAPETAVEIDGVLYDYYRLIKDEMHSDVLVSVKAKDTEAGSSTYIYNDDFAAAVSAGRALGVSEEEGGRPYQIRTQEQLRNINTSSAYAGCVFLQTLDIQE